jgi:DNA-binding transcriptional MerR regulator
MGRFYGIHEFADVAGVTIKALHHYDRLDLLKPGRTEAGYRMYAARDLERLEQIIALRFLGVPLKQIKVVLDRNPERNH